PQVPDAPRRKKTECASVRSLGCGHTARTRTTGPQQRRGETAGPKPCGEKKPPAHSALTPPHEATARAPPVVIRARPGPCARAHHVTSPRPGSAQSPSSHQEARPAPLPRSLAADSACVRPAPPLPPRLCGLVRRPPPTAGCASGAEVRDKMVPPVEVSPLIKLGRYSALFLGMAYGATRYNYLKPRAEEERRIEAEEKKRQDELKRIARELAEAQDDSILK
uniref:ATP synthase F(0) complex subunit e, mitochondrial n=1 Tax=Macaca mulatta TaxID=9544 RepID=A0A5F7ZD46_MACMU